MHLTATETVINCLYVYTQRITMHAILTIMASPLCSARMTRMSILNMRDAGQTSMPPLLDAYILCP